MKTNENFKKVLMELFDEKDIDPKYKQTVNTEAIMQEYNETMAEFKAEYAKQVKEERLNVIRSLTKDELAFIIDLYGQDIFSMYEKKSNVHLDCIVR